MNSDLLALLPDSAHIEHGHLYLDEFDTVELANRWGTPLYLYDLSTIEHRCRTYTDAVARYYPGKARIAYAAKAFLCTAMAQIIMRQGLDLDVVSGGEAHVALQAGFPAQRMHYHGNGKTRAELACALEAGIGTTVIDSQQEMETVSEMAATREMSVRAWLRVSPGIDVCTHRYRKTGILDSKFGFPISGGAAMEAIETAVRDPNIDLVGLHAHIGSQVSETDPFARTVEALVALSVDAMQFGFRLVELSPGGGLAIPYAAGTTVPHIGDHVRRICEALVSSCHEQGIPLPRLVLEPGRSIAGPAGIAIYRATARKDIPGVRSYVSVDGGLADNPRPALYQAAYSALLADKADTPAEETVTVAGRFCESSDILVRDVALPYTEPGNLVAVPCSGAYHLSMSSNYNLVPRPAVVLVGNGEARLMVRRETYRDLIRRDIVLPFREH